MRAFVSWDDCRVCEPCEARLVCQTRAVMKIDADEPAWIEMTRCNGCGDCLATCTYGAITWATADRAHTGLVKKTLH